MQKANVGICIIASGNYFQTRYVIETLTLKTNITGKIYVSLVKNDDIRLEDYLRAHPDVKEVYTDDFNNPLPVIKNRLINQVTEKYVCLFPANVLVNSFWAETLIQSHQNVIDSGIIGIRKDTDKVYFKPLLRHHATQDDYLENVLSNDTNSVEGLIFFEKELFDRTGRYDETFYAPGYEDMQLSYLFSNNGYNNYYVKGQTCLTLTANDETIYPIKTKDGENSFNEYKNKTFNTLT